MATFLYSCPVHGEFEEQHSISECLEDCPKCKEDGLDVQKLKRLIPSGINFVLSGGGWAKEGYS